MEWLKILTAIKDIGLGVCAFALCAWIVVYIVKKLAVSLDKLIVSQDKVADNLDKMLDKSERFMGRVKIEHEQADKAHEEFALQNKGITEAIGRINGYVKD